MSNELNTVITPAQDAPATAQDAIADAIANESPINPADVAQVVQGAQAPDKPLNKKQRRAAKKAAAQKANGESAPAKKGAKKAPPAEPAPRAVVWRAPTLGRNSTDRDFACLLLVLTPAPQTMAQLVERANTLAKTLGFPKYQSFEQEARNRGERCKFSHLRYKSYHDLTDSAEKAGAILKVRNGKRVTLQLGDKAPDALKPLRTAKRELEAKRKSESAPESAS